MSHWMEFISAETKEELEMLEAKSAVFHRPIAVVTQLSADETARRLHDERIKQIRDRQVELYLAEMKGEARGEVRGVDVSISINRAIVRCEADMVIANRYNIPIEKVREIRASLEM